MIQILFPIVVSYTARKYFSLKKLSLCLGTRLALDVKK